MTQRRRLDHFLVERAAEAGADVRDGVRVRGVEADGAAGMVVDVDGGRLRAAVVLGADGANGVCAKALGLGRRPRLRRRLRGQPRRGPRAAPAEHRGRVTLEIGTVPGGYGWIFPKGDHLNVGVGGWAAEGPRLRDHLDRLCAEHGIALDALTSLRGHRLPLRRSWGLTARGRAAVVGRRRGPGRPAVRRRDLRGVPQLEARQRGGAGRARRPGRRAGALPGPPAARARRPRGDGLGGEARARARRRASPSTRCARRSCAASSPRAWRSPSPARCPAAPCSSARRASAWGRRPASPREPVGLSLGRWERCARPTPRVAFARL